MTSFFVSHCITTKGFIITGVFDNTLDRSDRKISAHATLETPPHRTAFPTGKQFFVKFIILNSRTEIMKENVQILFLNVLVSLKLVV